MQTCELIKALHSFSSYAIVVVPCVTDTFLLTCFFFLRVSYVTGHWSVTGRSAGQGVVCGLVARRDVLFVGPFGRKVVFFLIFLFVILVVNNVNLENFGGVF